MLIHNKKVIIPDTCICVSIFSKIKGLMFTSKKAVDDRALIFIFPKPQRIALHMWFVFYPIDVIFTDEHKKIIDYKAHFSPCTFYTSKIPASFAIECAAGTIKKNKMRVGDMVRWQSRRCI